MSFICKFILARPVARCFQPVPRSEREMYAMHGLEAPCYGVLPYYVYKKGYNAMTVTKPVNAKISVIIDHERKVCFSFIPKY